MKDLFARIVTEVRGLFATDKFVPLHAPVFVGNEKTYLLECIDSTFVSSVGKFVDQFETMVAKVAGTRFAVATVNGTEALHIALLMAGVSAQDEVLTQPLSFIATVNAVAYCNASPVFIDVERQTLGMCPESLATFLEKNAEKRADGCYNKLSGKRLAACLPVHVFGHPCRIDAIVAICASYGIPIVEDAAEAIGSSYQGKSCGSFGGLGVFSFNGNKTITCGGGGAIVTDDATFAARAKHVTTTAKVPHPWDYVHDEVGYNYRLPNLNAALACAQLECLADFIERKRSLAAAYQTFFAGLGIDFVREPAGSRSNFWLNAIVLRDRSERDEFLRYTNERGIMTRPCWSLLHRLPMFQACHVEAVPNAEWLEDRVVNIPSSVRV